MHGCTVRFMALTALTLVQGVMVLIVLLLSALGRVTCSIVPRLAAVGRHLILCLVTQSPEIANELLRHQVPALEQHIKYQRCLNNSNGGKVSGRVHSL